MTVERKVVIVDDSAPIRKLGTKMLKAEGWGVVTAENGFDGIGVVSREMPDLVLMDVDMPELDGLTATAIIKESVKCCRIPVVLLTSKDSPFDKARGAMMGAEGYLTKPFTKERLLACVQENLEAK